MFFLFLLYVLLKFLCKCIKMNVILIFSTNIVIVGKL